MWLTFLAMACVNVHISILVDTIVPVCDEEFQLQDLLAIIR
jgi:hypothetical protein